MQQDSLSLIKFQKKFSTERACQKHLFRMRWPAGFECPRCGYKKASLIHTRKLYQCRACRYQASLTAGTIFHKTRTPLTKWFWMILLIGRQKSGISMLSLQRLLEIKTYRTVWTMGHKIRKAMTDRDSSYQLAGLLEMDDAFFGPSKPGKRGRGAEGKAKVVVAVETRNDRPRFAKMRKLQTVSGTELVSQLQDCLKDDVVIRTDGWRAYRQLVSDPRQHDPHVVGSGPNAVKILPWVHALIANVKGNIRGVHHGVSPKHLPRYLSEYCYRFNRRFWESQMFNRILNACLSTSTITFAELKA